MTPYLKPKIHVSRHLNMVSMLNLWCVCVYTHLAWDWLGHQQAMQFEELPMTAERSWRMTRWLWRLKDQAVFVGLHFYLWRNPTCLAGIKMDFSQNFCWDFLLPMLGKHGLHAASKHLFSRIQAFLGGISCLETIGLQTWNTVGGRHPHHLGWC